MRELILDLQYLQFSETMKRMPPILAAHRKNLLEAGFPADEAEQLVRDLQDQLIRENLVPP